MFHRLLDIYLGRDVSTTLVLDTEQMHTAFQTGICGVFDADFGSYRRCSDTRTLLDDFSNP